MKTYLLLALIFIFQNKLYSQDWNKLDKDSLDKILLKLVEKADYPQILEVATIAKKKAIYKSYCIARSKIKKGSTWVYLRCNFVVC